MTASPEHAYGKCGMPPPARVLPHPAALVAVRKCSSLRTANLLCLPTASVTTLPIELAERVLELRTQRATLAAGLALDRTP